MDNVEYTLKISTSYDAISPERLQTLPLSWTPIRSAALLDVDYHPVQQSLDSIGFLKELHVQAELNISDSFLQRKTLRHGDVLVCVREYPRLVWIWPYNIAATYQDYRQIRDDAYSLSYIQVDNASNCFVLYGNEGIVQPNDYIWKFNSLQVNPHIPKFIVVPPLLHGLLTQRISIDYALGRLQRGYNA